MAIKKRRDENGELETVLEGSIDEVTQPGAVDTLVEEASEFVSSLPHYRNSPEPVNVAPANLPVKNPDFFTGEDLSYFLVWGQIESNENALAMVRDPGKQPGVIVKQFEVDSLLNVSWYTDDREIRISFLRRLGGKPGLGVEPNILNGRAVKPNQGVIKNLGLPSLVIIAQNDSGKTLVQTFRQLKDFSIQGESQANLFAQVLEAVQFTARDVLFWEQFALVEDTEGETTEASSLPAETSDKESETAEVEGM